MSNFKVIGSCGRVNGSVPSNACTEENRSSVSSMVPVKKLSAHEKLTKLIMNTHPKMFNTPKFLKKEKELNEEIRKENIEFETSKRQSKKESLQHTVSEHIDISTNKPVDLFRKPNQGE